MTDPNDELDGVSVIGDVLAAAAPRPELEDATSKKVQYAVRFAEAMASRIARDLRPRLSGISATTARTAGSLRTRKQLDVNFSTPHYGLALGVSLKSVHLRDAKRQESGVKPGRYTHNMKRNEEELRIEAGGYHKRQPYAVMIAVLFLPFDSCDDGGGTNPSSFGSWVRHLRPYAGRMSPDDATDKFEKIFIALYAPDGTALRFFDVESDPPKRGRPSSLFTYIEFLDACYHAYLKRNSAEFRWADGEEAPLALEEVDGETDGEEESDA